MNTALTSKSYCLALRNNPPDGRDTSSGWMPARFDPIPGPASSERMNQPSGIAGAIPAACMLDKVAKICPHLAPQFR